KSRGNIVRPHTVLDVLGNDALRYFLLREVVFGHDGSFSFDALVQRYNADLANDLGNLASRTLTMMGRYFEGKISMRGTPGAAEAQIEQLAARTIAEFDELFASNQISRALEVVWALVRSVNKYLVETEPWTLGAKDDAASRGRLAAVLYTAAEALRITCALAHPVVPEATARVWNQLGAGDVRQARIDRLTWGELQPGTGLGQVEGVFPRADKAAIAVMQQKEAEYHAKAGGQSAPAAAKESKAMSGEKTEQQSSAPAGTHAQAGQPAAQSAVGPSDAAPAPAGVAAPAAAAGAKITIEDFLKVELRVAQVKVAERVKGADKLLRLEVDLGTEVRQIVAGIAKAYEPEALVGRKIVIVANLQPRKLRGLESNGMLLAASVGEEGTPVLAGFLEDVPVGAKLK
ncbi:MAG TPA: methionine--tRNA ligase subunit beta, partial [Terriglobales bacterium]|nr:methionine--tRNA ligase subunit beta [Terriglobales bacterium]